jgi:hypothetical protein
MHSYSLGLPPPPPRTSPLWQIVHYAWDDFHEGYEARHRQSHGPLRLDASAVQTFGDYLNFHPHLHVLAATGLVNRDGRFHLMPVESIGPLAELLRHRFISTLLHKKLISAKRAHALLGWTHSGFNLDAGEKPVAADDADGLRRLSSGHGPRAARQDTRRPPFPGPQWDRSAAPTWWHPRSVSPPELHRTVAKALKSLDKPRPSA